MGWMTLDLIRRLLREPQVVRSLLWPVALVPLTLMLTVFGFVWLEGNWPVAVSPTLNPEIHAAMEADGFILVAEPNPRTAVQNGSFRYGTDGDRLWVGNASGRSLQVERSIRMAKGASWRVGQSRQPQATEREGARVMGVIGILFVLFGVVFGAGMVARDRDDGTLEALLSVGVARWTHGASRGLAGTLVLVLHYTLAVMVIRAVMGIENYGLVARNGLAACSTGVFIGLMVVGRSGLKNGFSGPLAGGLTLVALLVGTGLTVPMIGRHLPVSSLVTNSSGWTPLCMMLGFAGLSVITFSRRSTGA